MIANIFNFKEKYEIYKDDILHYVVNLERMFSASTFILFFGYFVYMKLRHEIYRGDAGLSMLLCLCMVTISLIDFLIVEKYVKYHEDKALMVSTIRSVFMFVILFFMDLFSNISFTLVSSCIMFMSITNIIPLTHIMMILGFAIVNTANYLLFNGENPSVVLFFDVIVDNLFVVLISVGINIIFSTLKYREFEYKKELILENNMDFLTKLYNRKYVQKYVTSFEGKNKLSAMVIIDLDNFKEINDSFGHISGDELLIDIADILRECFKDVRCISRLGGDEFLLFSAYIDNRDDFLEEVGRFMERFPITMEKNGISVKVSASVGIVFSDTGEKNLYEKMYKLADEAMYKSKVNGKNQYFIA
ncbi:diguanylate cyclase (GGDEF) domain protein [[Eubacterium] yurii subsp. margaretiae ATCC 43715]|nr:diguanylate cyclase (GGDEF) domain protein [[Eubacterium] yurii subsp. margaretiae ATCC 43715]